MRSWPQTTFSALVLFIGITLLATDAMAVDTDGDFIDDPFDNCPINFNPDQTDTDGDGFGNACDGCPTVFDPTNLCLCGNDTLDPGEQCDDGNNTSFDGCSSGCQIEEEGIPTIPLWGLLILAAMLLGTSAWLLRRQRGQLN